MESFNFTQNDRVFGFQIVTLLCVRLETSNMYIPNLSLHRHGHLTPSQLRPHSSPNEPMNDAEQQDTSIQDSERIVQIAFRAPATTRRNKPYNDDVDVGDKVQHSYRKM
jgi:hypothetical protein